MELGNRAIGARGELLVAEEFLRRGFAVYTPLVDAGADLIVDVGGRLLRVQVKAYSGDDDTHVFKLGHKLPNKPGWQRYDEGDLDLYALCWINKGYVALLPNCETTAIRVTVGSDRSKEIEIGAVLARIMEEN